MADHHFVIIGNGPAGNQAALTLRDKAPDARITLISRHPGGCYRPHLLPHFIAGQIEEEALYVFSPSSYKDKNIKLRSGQEVAAIDLEKREIVLDHKEVVAFHGLILAVGGRPRTTSRSPARSSRRSHPSRSFRFPQARRPTSSLCSEARRSTPTRETGQ